jgi:hypothetical protein
MGHILSGIIPFGKNFDYFKPSMAVRTYSLRRSGNTGFRASLLGPLFG